jgi:uncharacterized protein
MNEQDLQFSSGSLLLAGTLATPDRGGPFPCVLLLPGSGRVDRDENLKKLPIDVLRQVAADLAGRGIASFRYDKRGVGSSQGHYGRSGLYDHVADAEAALTFLAVRPDVAAGRLFVLGHSEGAYISVRVAAERPDLAGVVLLAGGARTGEEELRWQARRVVDTLTGFNAFLIRLLRIDPLKSQAKFLEKIKRSSEDTYRVRLRKINAKWMREFLAYDPAPDLARIRAPILAITGAKDIQVDPANLERMGKIVAASFEAHVVPDVTHLLRRESGPGGIRTYKEQVKRPVAPEVLALIGLWVKKQATGEAAGER